MALSQVHGQAVGLGPCNLNLNDGLACSVNWARDDWETRANAIDASCYDANANYKSYRYTGALGKKSAQPKRRAQ